MCQWEVLLYIVIQGSRLLTPAPRAQCPPLNPLHLTSCVVSFRGPGLKEHFSSAHIVSELIYMVPSNLREYRVGNLDETGNEGKRAVVGG